MGEVFAYSISSGIILIMMYIVYKHLMSKEKQPSFNRITIYAIYICALTLPAVTKIHYFTVTVNNTEIGIGTPLPITIGEISGQPIIITLFLWIYATGITVTITYLFYSFISLYKIILNGKKTRYADYTLVIIHDNRIAPFNWGKYVVMSDTDYTENSSTILFHELHHLKKYHFIDLLIAQATTVFQWYNPVAWLMITELKNLHEYQADDAVINSGADPRKYQTLLIKKAVGTRLPSLANSLNHNNIKKRIIMMNKSKTTPRKRLMALALIPAIAISLMAVNYPVIDSALTETALSAMLPKAKSKVIDNSGTNAASNGRNDIKVYEKVDVEPQFPEGIEGLRQYLIANIKYPDEAMKAKEQGTVIVKFVITKKGKVTDVNISRGISPSLDNEAKRVIKSMPDWTPGKLDGEYVDCQYYLPVSFMLM